MNRPSVYRVGLTGGIASGKSTVANLFAEFGVPVIDTDVIAREVVVKGSPLLQALVEAFGKGILASDGTLDRKAMRDRVFGASIQATEARATLNALMHPAIRTELEQQSILAGGPYQILVIPLLVEGGKRDHIDRVLVVDVDEATQLRRLQERDGSSPTQARAILEAQVDRATRLAAADDVIRNDAGIEALREQVRRLHETYLAAARRI